MKGIGYWESEMGTVFKSGMMAQCKNFKYFSIVTRATGRQIRVVERENSSMPMGICTKEIGTMTKLMERVFTSMLTVRNIKEMYKPIKIKNTVAE